MRCSGACVLNTIHATRTGSPWWIFSVRSLASLIGHSLQRRANQISRLAAIVCSGQQIRSSFAEFPFGWRDPVPSAPCPSRAQSLPHHLFPLMRVISERLLFGRQVREKAKPSDAIGADSLAVDPRVAPYKVAQVIPVEFRAVLEFPHQACGIERIARLP